ncbi:MAG: hypothetical protein AB7E96_04540 [Deferribacterales bacterium]
MKKNSGTDLVESMTDDEMQRVMLLKSGLEDLNLVLQEIEDTYLKLAEVGITEAEKKNQRLRLFALEKYLSELNTKVNTALGSESDRQKLS